MVQLCVKVIVLIVIVSIQLWNHHGLWEVDVRISCVTFPTNLFLETLKS